MDGEEEVLVRGGADRVCREEEGSREDGDISETCRAEDLEGYYAEHDVSGQWLDAAELEDLRWPVSNGLLWVVFVWD